jgi:hypothetical protein
MDILLFSPIGVKSRDYKSKYPELAGCKEFESFTGKELGFIWWYANATSPITDLKDEERVKEAIKRSGYNPEPAEYERLVDLNFSERFDIAADKMKSFIPGARFFGWRALKNIFKQYQDIASKQPADFIKKVGSGENATEETDYAAYTRVTSDVIKNMPLLIQRLEEGFGINISDISDEDEEGGVAQFREWHLSKLED